MWSQVKKLHQLTDMFTSISWYAIGYTATIRVKSKEEICFNDPEVSYISASHCRQSFIWTLLILAMFALRKPAVTAGETTRVGMHILSLMFMIAEEYLK